MSKYTRHTRVTKDTYNHEARVLLDHAVVASFNVISDDYAYTHQEGFAGNLSLNLHKGIDDIEAVARSWNDIE